MTKQPPYATMLRLSKICRWFAAVALVKLCLLLALVLGLPLPELSLVFTSTAQQTPHIPDTPGPTPPAVPQGTPQAEPQGAAAARAAAQMHPAGMRAQVQMPVPQTAAAPTPWIESLQQDSPAPVAQTTTAPPAKAAPPHAADSAWWGTLMQLTRLPVPRLGVDQAAYAATLDAPPPPEFAPRNVQSPFVPPAQAIPQGQNPDGSPIPPRSTTARPLPAGQAGPRLDTPADTLPPSLTPRADAPAPSVTSPTLPEDPARQQQELARREQEVLVLKQQMEQRLQELQQTERKVQDMLKEARALEEKKVNSLAAMYINMKPKQAAKALEALDERIAIKILASMTPKQSGDILTYTDPKKTAKLTELISRMRLEQ